MVVIEEARAGMNCSPVTYSSVNLDKILYFSEAFTKIMTPISGFVVYGNQWTTIFTLAFIGIKRIIES